MGGLLIATSKDLVTIGILFLLFLAVANARNGSDADALLAFKDSADLGRVLDPNWKGTKADQCCRWQGVKECANGRVTKLVVEHLQLNGTFAENTLSRMDQLRVLSLKGNRLRGPIPDLSGLHNLKILFLDQNEFTGQFPESISRLRRLTVLVLAGNRLSGEIPVSVTGLQRLLVFRVESNRLNGRIPPLNQTGLGVLNVSNNGLSGSIPRTVALALFNSSSFRGNPGLCGGPGLMPRCATIMGGPPSPAPRPSRVPSLPQGTGVFPRGSDKFSAGKIAGIVVGVAVGLAAIFLLSLVALFRRRRPGTRNGGESRVRGEALGSHELQSVRSGSGEKNTGKLVFCGGQTRAYSLEDLLCASAEVLGKGTIGTTYKAVMESSLVVTVKRLRNTNQLSSEEFEGHLETVGMLRHANIISLRAYFQAKEERLLVYDYQPNGSLYSLIHGSRSSGGKPLHWTSCMKIAEDIANGLAYIHQASTLIHGNLKSSNVLLGKDFEACITDIGLTVFDAEQPEDASVAGYRAPECRAGITTMASAKSDVYSYGVLLLELLTGKAPLPSFLEGPATDLPRWVRSVREEEMGSRVFDDSLSGTDGSDDKLALLLNIATLCVSPSPDRRPTMRDVLRMIEEEVKDTQISSDHSPRWSEAIHSFPRDNGSDRSFGPERD